MLSTVTKHVLRILLGLFLGVLPFFSAHAQDAGMEAVRSVEEVLMRPDANLDAFIEEKLSDSYRQSMSDEAIRDHLSHYGDKMRDSSLCQMSSHIESDKTINVDCGCYGKVLQRRLCQ